MSSLTVQNAPIEIHADSNEEKGDLAELRCAKVSLGDDCDPLDAEQIGNDPIREARMAISIRNTSYRNGNRRSPPRLTCAPSSSPFVFQTGVPL